MKKTTINRTLWVSGLLTGVLIGAYLYKNQEELKPQQKKLKKLIDELKNTASDFGSKMLKAGQEQLAAAKNVSQETIEDTKTVAKNAAETIKN